MSGTTALALCSTSGDTHPHDRTDALAHARCRANGVEEIGMPMERRAAQTQTVCWHPMCTDTDEHVRRWWRVRYEPRENSPGHESQVSHAAADTRVFGSRCSLPQTTPPYRHIHVWKALRLERTKMVCRDLSETRESHTTYGKPVAQLPSTVYCGRAPSCGRNSGPGMHMRKVN